MAWDYLFVRHPADTSADYRDDSHSFVSFGIDQHLSRPRGRANRFEVKTRRIQSARPVWHEDWPALGLASNLHFSLGEELIKIGTWLLPKGRTNPMDQRTKRKMRERRSCNNYPYFQASRWLLSFYWSQLTRSMVDRPPRCFHPTLLHLRMRSRGVRTAANRQSRLCQAAFNI